MVAVLVLREKGDFKMFFANLIGEKGVGEFKRLNRKNTIPFINNTSELYEDAQVQLKDGKLVVEKGNPEDDVFKKDMLTDEHSVYLEKLGCKMTVGQLADTEENPMFTVLSDSVKFYVGVPSLIKYIHIGNGIFALCLVYGACEFKCFDGSYVPMSRNITVDLSGRELTAPYTDEKLREMASTVDKESDYDMAFDVVNAVLVDVKNKYVSRYKTVKDAVYVLSTVNRDERRRLLSQKKEEEEARRKAKKEENKKFMEAQKEKARAIQQEEVEKQFAKPKNTKLPKVEEGSTGAQNFMAALRNLGYAK